MLSWIGNITVGGMRKNGNILVDDERLLGSYVHD